MFAPLFGIKAVALLVLATGLVECSSAANSPVPLRPRDDGNKATRISEIVDSMSLTDLGKYQALSTSAKPLITQCCNSI